MGIAVHTLSHEALGEGGIMVAQLSMTKQIENKTVYIIYFNEEYTEDRNDYCIFRLKPRQTPLTAEQWQQRVKDIQRKAEWNKVRNAASETISKAVQAGLQLSKPILKNH